MRINKNKAVMEQKIDGELYLYNTETENLVQLNKTAESIWNLEYGREDEEILDEFLSMFIFEGCTESAGIKDFNEIIGILIEAGCLEIEEEGGSYE